MRKFFGPTGSVSRSTVESEVLKSNMLGDPTARVVDVYIPAGHDGQGLPLLVDLVGFTGSGLSHTNWTGFRENLPERLDRLIGEQRMPPVVVAFPDCFTRLGGNQYINSAYCMNCCRQSSSASNAAALGGAACLAKAPAGMVPSPTHCATPRSGRRRPVIPAIWGSRCAICRTCLPYCARWLVSRTRSSAGGSSLKQPKSTRKVPAR
jgi:hypothetical protein